MSRTTTVRRSVERKSVRVRRQTRRCSGVYTGPRVKGAVVRQRARDACEARRTQSAKRSETEMCAHLPHAAHLRRHAAEACHQVCVSAWVSGSEPLASLLQSLPGSVTAQ